MTYYEQVSIDGAAVANDCTPSLLTVPTMLAWCFVYEGIDGKSLDLLSALPKDWYGKPFAARGIGYSGGVVDTVSDGKSIRIDIGGVPTVPIRLILRGTDSISEEAVTVGKERIISIENNTVIFTSDVGHIEINLLYPDNK